MADLIFTETFNRCALSFIIRHFNDVYKSNSKSDDDRKSILSGLRSYLKSANNDGSVEIKYKQKAYNIGRVYSHKYSLQKMPRVIRNAIVPENVKDIDIRNAHPEILSQLCKQKNIISPFLDDYVANREEWLTKLNPNDRNDAKDSMIKIMYGGQPPNTTFDKIVKFYDELRNVTYLLTAFPEFKKQLKLSLDKRQNIDSFLSLVLQDIENDILHICIKYCRINDIKIHTLMYDGFTSENVINLNALSNYVFEQSTFRVAFIEKEMDTNITIPLNAIDTNAMYSYFKCKEDFEVHCCKIMNPINFMDYGVLLSKENLRTKYENLFFQDIKDDKIIDVCFINEWFKDPEMKTYDSVGLYPPPLSCPIKCLNTYKPIHWDTIDVSFDKNDINTQKYDPYYKHVFEVICNKDDNIFRYIEGWIASIIQNPGIKTGVVLSIVGAEGIGKTLFTKFINKLIGNDKYLETNDPELHIFGRFANWYDKSVIVLNDYNPGETRGKDSDKFKSIITETKTVLDRKGINAIETNNYSNFITTTNSYNPVKKTNESRRYLVFEASSCKKGDSSYFRKLDEYINDDGNLLYMYNYFKNYDLTIFNMRIIPETELGNLLIQENSSPVQCFFNCKSNILKIIEHRKDTDNGFFICKKDDELALPCISQRKLTELFLNWCSMIENNIDKTKWNSKKLQTEIFKNRNEFKLEFRVNKSNSHLSMWILNDINIWLPNGDSNDDSELDEDSD